MSAASNHFGSHKAAAAAYEKFIIGLGAEKARGDPLGILPHKAAYLAKLRVALRKSGRPSVIAVRAAQLSEVLPSSYITRSLTAKPRRTRGINVAWRDNPFVDVPILFEFDSDRVGNSDMLQLKEIAKGLNDPAIIGSRILVEGHTDAAGSEEYNLRLSIQRARSVKKLLVEKFGVDNKRVSIKGYGESMLAANGVWT